MRVVFVSHDAHDADLSVGRHAATVVRAVFLEFLK
jgi:hypothetical protein